MKFLALRSALEKAFSHEKSNHNPSGGSTATALKKDEEPRRLPFYNPGAAGVRERVAGGEILWKPVDRLAARLLQKSPWWAKPPDDCKTTVIKEKPKAMNTNNKSLPNRPHPAQGDNVEVVQVKSQDQLNSDIAGHFIKKTDKALDETAQLYNRAVDARVALDELCDKWKTSWLDFIDNGNQRLVELRMLRMSIDTETRQIMGSFREVRMFFLDKDHDVEVARLKEFVELCERLQKLKASGFLDTVADTLLKLA